ncbi:MAG TPA: hypothetical protein VHX44_00750, partial [Planctomycetota bacterium]|nr:hypothetical protein [Planctomycetota bacterium]
VDPDVPEYIRTALRNALSAAPGMSAAITAAIVDWQDEDDTPDKDGGAERNDGAYQGAKIPYALRNAKVETIDELRLVRGVTDAVFFGEDTNGNGRLDPGEDTNGNGKLDPGLRDVVTLESREPRTAPQGGDRTLATNKGAVTVLIGKLITDTSRAKELSDEIGQLQTITNRLHLLCSLDLSDDEIDTLWPDLVDRDVTPAAPGGGGGQPPAQMSRLGLVDAASCNEAVLGGLLNDPALAARIVAARPTTATPSVAWLVHALSKADADRIGTLLTCGSFQFRADLLAVSRSGSGWARLDAYITCETSFPTITHLRPAKAAG